MNIYNDEYDAEMQDLIGHEKQPAEHFSIFSLIFLGLFGWAFWIVNKIKSMKRKKHDPLVR